MTMIAFKGPSAWNTGQASFHLRYLALMFLEADRTFSNPGVIV